jgi:hypothetical protein
MKRCLLSLIVFLGILSALHAQIVLVDNTGTASNGTSGVTSGTWQAAQFTTDNQAYTLDSVAFLLSTSSAGSITAKIYSSDGSNSPITELGTLTLAGSVTGTLSNVSFTAGSTINLAANTSYWVSLEASSGTYAWSWPDSGTGASHTGPGTIENKFSSSFNSGASWSGGSTSSPYQFQVNATAVPEPSSYALLLGGVALLGVTCTRRRQRN